MHVLMEVRFYVCRNLSNVPSALNYRINHFIYLFFIILLDLVLHNDGWLPDLFVFPSNLSLVSCNGLCGINLNEGTAQNNPPY